MKGAEALLNKCSAMDAFHWKDRQDLAQDITHAVRYRRPFYEQFAHEQSHVPDFKPVF
jgi:hypothetical protein